LRLEKQFDVDRSRDEAVECVVQDATLIGLFPDAETEIVESRGDRRTVRSHYRALGREGTATFHFDFLLDGGVRFEKLCDGKVWRRLVGQVSFEERGARTRVRIELDGQTRPLVPEFTIKGAMRDQLEQMARALRQRIEST
jgi:carbon monoxide dehydrogenase subunit G